jgi:hypothetical protein
MCFFHKTSFYKLAPQGLCQSQLCCYSALISKVPARLSQPRNTLRAAISRMEQQKIPRRQKPARGAETSAFSPLFAESRSLLTAVDRMITFALD